MDLARSIALLVAAAFAQIGGTWLVWQGVREHQGCSWMDLDRGGRVWVLGLDGFVGALICLLGVAVIMPAPREV